MKKVMLLIDVEDDVNLEDIRASITINSLPIYDKLKFKNIPDKKYMKERNIKNEKQASDYLMLKCFYDGYNACVEDLLQNLWSVDE